MIEVIDLKKTFHVTKRKSSTGHAIKSFLKKETRIIEALAGISFTIPDGEIVGYIGPNGAGKSTTIKILSGILTPDSGICQVNGYVPWQDRKAYVQQIGVVFGQRSQLWWDIPVMGSFYLLKEIYKVKNEVFNETLDELIELLDLQEIVTMPTRQLSLGQRMRCEIAAALLHRPKILFLDEPTIGLDAVSKLAVRSFIKKINDEFQTTVILTTHDMQDIEHLAQRILMIGKGELLFDGDLSKFMAFKTHETSTLDELLVNLYQQYELS